MKHWQNRLTPFVCAACVAACVLTPMPAFGYLRIHPSNPHYFQETTTGDAVMITTFTNIAPSDASFNYTTAFRQDTQSRRMMYIRVWHFTPWSFGNAIWPWATGSGSGYWGGLGGTRLNMTNWNNTYWTRMNDAMSRANNAGVYAEIMLFDGVGIEAGNDRWGDNPWAANNNNNSLEVPIANSTNSGTSDFYSYATKPNLRNQQERYVRRMIDQTIAYPNIIYEVENEHRSSSNSFGSYYGQFIKDYIAATYPSSPRLVSYSSIDADLDSFYSLSSVDVVNKHFGNSAENDPNVMNTYLEPKWSFNKPTNVDEFANGVVDANLMRQMCWVIIASGAHFHVEDADPAAVFDAVENIRSFKALANWNFIGAAPNKALITAGGGYCLANVGEEYVCYFPTGGSKTVNLAAATYRSEWWNPRTGAFSGVTTFAHGGGNKSFSTPDANDWVLHVTTRSVLNTTLDSKPAGAITIDGNSADWNLGQYTTKIFAGNTGSGDTAIIGYNGFENWTCYAAAHATGIQFPPSDATDHAARVYSQHDTNYLYFLVRVDDSNRQTPNGVANNAINDCVEFYIDPGNAGGASAMSNSSSDVQLVIDAANQKNVYVATPAYTTQVLNGVTSAVVTDAAGWWLEVRIAKTALSPAIPANVGTIGLDFNFHDNDSNNAAAQSTSYTWREMSTAGFPSKIPDHWGKLNLIAAGGAPGQAGSPAPANAATGVGITSTVSWTAGSGATSHDVYFGTSSPGTFRGNQAGTTYNPGALSVGTQYFWRIDEKNANGTTTGTVWSFTTLPLPGQASSPNPANAATNVSTVASLSWTAGSNATSHDVYFGTSNPPAFVQNQGGTSYSPGTMTPGATYFWRIDEKNSSGTTTGTVWSFSTPSLPGQASNPSPANAATHVNTSLTLSWTAGSNAASHDIRFGTANPPPFVTNQSGTTYNPGVLSPIVTYFWRIDEKNGSGTTTGPVWSFTTGLFVNADFDGDGDVDQEDFGHLQGCVNTGPVGAGCANADLNADQAVDGDDMGLFLPCLNGPGQSPGC